MTITYYGENCFKIQIGETTVLTDPLEISSGLTPPRFKYDAVIKTLSVFPPVIDGDVLTISGPGEYNFKDITVNGWPVENESTEKIIKTSYLILAEEMKIVFPGHLSEMPAASLTEHWEGVDILFIPAGGKPFIDQKTAIKIVRQIQPKLVIPAFYKVPGLKRPAEDLNIFSDEFNHGETEQLEKLTIKKKDLASVRPMQLKVFKF